MQWCYLHGSDITRNTLEISATGKQAVSIKSDINEAAVTLVENPVIQF